MWSIAKCSHKRLTFQAYYCAGRARWTEKEAIRIRHISFWPSWLLTKEVKGCQIGVKGDSPKIHPGLGPLAPRIPRLREAGHLKWIDNYSWMEDSPASSAVLRQHLREEVQHHRRTMERLGVPSTARKLLAEMLASQESAKAHLIPNLPEKIGQYLYTTYEDTDGITLSRQRESIAADELLERVSDDHSRAIEVVLDPEMVSNDVHLLSKSKDLPLGTEVCSLRLSPDQQYVAYMVPLQRGIDHYCCIIREISKGRHSAGKGGHVVGFLADVSGFEFSADSRWLLYTTPDDLGRPCKVHLHDFHPAEDAAALWTLTESTCEDSDQLLWMEPRPEYFVQLSRTKDWEWLLININSKTSSEVHVLPGFNPRRHPLHCLKPRTPGLEYFVQHHHGNFVIMTNCSREPSTDGPSIMTAPQDPVKCKEPSSTAGSSIMTPPQDPVKCKEPSSTAGSSIMTPPQDPVNCMEPSSTAGSSIMTPPQDPVNCMEPSSFAGSRIMTPPHGPAYNDQLGPHQRAAGCGSESADRAQDDCLTAKQLATSSHVLANGTMSGTRVGSSSRERSRASEDSYLYPDGGCRSLGHAAYRIMIMPSGGLLKAEDTSSTLQAHHQDDPAGGRDHAPASTGTAPGSPIIPRPTAVPAVLPGWVPFIGPDDLAAAASYGASSSLHMMTDEGPVIQDLAPVEIVDMDVFNGWLVLHTRLSDGRPGLTCSSLSHEVPPFQQSQLPPCSNPVFAIEASAPGNQLTTHRHDGRRSPLCAASKQHPQSQLTANIPTGTSDQSQLVTANIPAATSDQVHSYQGLPQPVDSTLQYTDAAADNKLQPAMLPLAKMQHLQLPHWVLHINPGANQDFNSHVYRFTCSSPVHPPLEYVYEFRTGLLQPLSSPSSLASSYSSHAGGVDSMNREAVQEGCEDARAVITGHGNAASKIRDTGVGPVIYSQASSSTSNGSTPARAAISDTAWLPCLSSQALPTALPYRMERHMVRSSDGATLLPLTILEASPAGSATTATLLSATSTPSMPPTRYQHCSAWLHETGEGGAGSHQRITAAAAVQPAADVQPSRLLLCAYGAYGQIMDMSFDPNLQVLLDRGWRVAYAHVRGGGELGRSWHAGGRGSNRHHALQDYLACTRYLIQKGYSQPGMMAGQATSAGALLLASALILEPAIFGAAVLRVPFTDVLTCMMNPDLPLTAHEREEWCGLEGEGVATASTWPSQDSGGVSCPDVRTFTGLQTSSMDTNNCREVILPTGLSHSDLDQIRQMCPYQQLITHSSFDARAGWDIFGGGPQPIPDETAGIPRPATPSFILLSCSLDDSRVPFWCATKWAAAFRQKQQVDLITRSCGVAKNSVSENEYSVCSSDLIRDVDVVMRIREFGGHFGTPSQQIEELSEDYAFLIESMERK
ncbi:hypothetical protein CEUSTIGMA_g9084.t1 [Chlamydomonas eustigma]|uniref:Prolyl endopeptidase-like n=1 Tax=Chlamydomonas eustigma TaxID=1157962 RepID=A0A250XF46_9CHLO|nr:hypothetical protein CEUSTIGMA_g9084.t1 [Chlamydomonas eustigma]|eukprot:GAX81656.1 hypothetical protein CEUSTIGMA_g9084.t1 [Chlamydomonas eustigma]